MKPETTAIGGIGNYYGGLLVKIDDGKYFWGIENWEGIGWEEIPESLYRELIAFNERRVSESYRDN